MAWYVARTNHIAALGYISRTKNVTAFGFHAPITAFESCFLVTEVMESHRGQSADGQQPIKEPSLKYYHFLFSVFSLIRDFFD